MATQRTPTVRYYIVQQTEPGDTRYWTRICWTDKGREDAERIRKLLRDSCSTPLRIRKG